MTVETHHLVSDRPRCPNHPGRLIDRVPCPRCGCFEPQVLVESCEQKPVLALVPEPEQREGSVIDVITEPQVESDTDGQLTLPGLPAVQRVPVVWKPYWEMSRREFLAQDWRLEEDDRMAVRVKDGVWQVTVTRKGVTE